VRGRYNGLLLEGMPENSGLLCHRRMGVAGVRL
jgi:hypothetical protein